MATSTWCVKVKTPTDLSARERELYEELARIAEKEGGTATNAASLSASKTPWASRWLCWLELSVTADIAAVEAGLSAIFQEYGEGGVAINQPVVSDPEGEHYGLDTARPAVVTTYLPLDERGPRAAGEHRAGAVAPARLRPGSHGPAAGEADRRAGLASGLA